jgi:hypothetical protein
LDAHRGIGTLVTDIGGYLSEFDPVYGEFYVDVFAPGRTFSFPQHQDHSVLRHLSALNVSMQLEETLDAYVWKVTPEQAAEIIGTFEDESNSGRRRVVARATIRITGARADSGFDRRLMGELTSYTLRTREGTLLREFALEP